MVLTNEDLLAISEIMDTKLKSELQPLKDDMRSVKEEVQSVKEELQSVKEEVQSIKDKVQMLKDKVQILKDELQVMMNRIQAIENGLHNVKLFQENVIVPRLDTIEACYIGTYQRYQNQADRMEAAYDDIDLLKKVAAEHSEKLQKLA